MVQATAGEDANTTLTDLDRGDHFETLATHRRGEVLYWESSDKAIGTPLGWAPVVAFEDDPERERMLHPDIRVRRVQ